LLDDLGLILTNTKMYYGNNSTEARDAEDMIEVAKQEFAKYDDQFAHLEMSINPEIVSNRQV